MRARLGIAVFCALLAAGAGARAASALETYVPQTAEVAPGAVEQLALSADGTTALLGHENHASIFVRDGHAWSEQASLPEDEEGRHRHVGGLSEDGDTALLPDGNTGTLVYGRTGSSWSLLATLPASVAAAISGDGQTIVLVEAEKRGSLVMTYTHGTEGWEPGSSFQIESGATSWAPGLPSLSRDGRTMVLEGSTGAFETHADVFTGWIYTRSGETWTQGPRLRTAGADEATFVDTTAISGDGSTAMLTRNEAGEGKFPRGAAWIYERSGESWSEGTELNGGKQEKKGGIRFGEAAALSYDGSTAAIGARFDEKGHGAVWFFRRSAGHWAQFGSKHSFPTSDAVDRSDWGEPVALSADAGTLLAGTTSFSTPQHGVGVMYDLTLAPVEAGECVAAAKKTGEFSAATCEKAKVGANFEWRPELAGSSFATSAATPVTLATVGGTTVHCTGEAGAGTYISPSSIGSFAMTLTGCEQAGHSCASSGAGAGEVQTAALEGPYGVITAAKKAKADVLGVALSPAGGFGPVAEMLCGSTPIVLRGSVIAPIASGLMRSSDALPFSQNAGHQEPESFAGGPPQILEASVAGGAYEQAGLGVTLARTSEHALELNPLF